MQAEILAIGSELLDAPRRDTNSDFLVTALAGLGIRVRRVTLLPDETGAIAAAIRDALGRVSLVFCGGGLGPTEDDLTRQAAATALDCPLVRDPGEVNRLRQFFADRGVTMPEANLRQADRLAAAEWLPNPIGTASGQWAPAAAGTVVLLPGPPREMRPMFESHVRPRLEAMGKGNALFTRVLCIVPVGESPVDEVAAPIYRTVANPTTTILSTGEPQIELHFRATASSPAEAQALADALARRVEQALTARFGDVVFARRPASLAAVVGQRLMGLGQTLAVAESCTGGMLGERLTAAAGASRFFLGGLLVYSNSAKQALAGVRAATLTADGAVSAACAMELAAGARQRLAADWGLAITGIAGPDGGSEEKPVGTVFVGLCGPNHPAAAFPLQLHGTRDRIRRLSCQQALNLLRLKLPAEDAAGNWDAPAQ